LRCLVQTLHRFRRVGQKSILVGPIVMQ